MRITRSIAPAAAFAFLTACAGRHALVEVPPLASVAVPDAQPQELADPSTPRIEDDRSRLGDRVVAHAQAFAVAGKLPAGARHDCSGFVTAVYEAAGQPLEIPDRYQKSHSVAEMLHDWSAGEKRSFKNKKPAPGDLVFFKDTTGPRKGAVTHIALVERVGDDGTVTFLHYMGGKIRHDALNLARPTDPSVNAYLRRKKSHADNSPVLAGQLFVSYARFDEGGGGAPAGAREAKR